MAMEPINIFSHRIDPRGVVALLRSLSPTITVTGPDDAWQEATATITHPGQKGRTRLTFRHDPDYYGGPGWPRQVLGMPGYFSRFPEGGRKPDVLRLIATFRFALSTDWEPDLDPEGDERLPYLFAVTRHLDGVLFTPSSLRDAEGRILISADGEFDPDAVLTKMPTVAASDELGRQAHGLAVRLRPTVLDDVGLEAALGQLVGEWSARAGVPVDFQTSGLEDGRLPPEVETVLYRVAQDDLTNVARHARASTVSVVVSRHGGTATVAIEDDGVGFDPETAGPGRLGLRGMRERVALAGGELDVESTPGAGTTIIARIRLGGGP